MTPKTFLEWLLLSVALVSLVLFLNLAAANWWYRLYLRTRRGRARDAARRLGDGPIFRPWDP